MDNLCHTLVGGLLAQCGLKRRTALATATLVIAANLPDVDVISIAFDRSLEWRRGWTHGVLALVLFPVLLTGIMLWVARLRGRPAEVPVRPRGLLLLSTLGVGSHPLLDFMNNYGVRWLMPFADRWYYGDSLFIVDPWLWLLLGGGIWLARRRERRGDPDWPRPARLTLALGSIYVGAMIGSTLVARTAIAESLEREGRLGVFMATAVPVDPLRKEVVLDEGTGYRVGRFRFLEDPRLVWDGTVGKGPLDHPAVIRAAGTDRVRGFLHWSRLPAARTVGADSTVLRLYDLRYTDGRDWSWASVDLSGAGTASGSR